MLDDPVRRTPHASRLMIDLLHAIAACADLVQGWDLGKRPEGIVLHARSRLRHPSEEDAAEAAECIVRRMVPPDYDGEVLQVVTRPDGTAAHGWYATVEMVFS